jgi:hypothetical protein
MTKLILAEDVAYAISCVQDHQSTINTDSEDGLKTYDEIMCRIDRLLKFYYDLIGFDPYREKK